MDAHTVPPERPPVIYLISGPNGAGKTTFAKEFLPSAHVVEFLNADLLAAGLSPLQPGAMAVRSGRMILARWRELLAMRRDFAFESTLSGRTSMQRCSRRRRRRVTAFASLIFGCRMCGYRCVACVKEFSPAAMTFRSATCGGDSSQASSIFSVDIARSPTKLYYSTRHRILRD
jgi:hypothetical protein